MNISSNIIEGYKQCKIDNVLACIGILKYNIKIMLNCNVLAAIFYVTLILMITSLGYWIIYL